MPGLLHIELARTLAADKADRTEMRTRHVSALATRGATGRPIRGGGVLAVAAVALALAVTACSGSNPAGVHSRSGAPKPPTAPHVQTPTGPPGDSNNSGPTQATPGQDQPGTAQAQPGNAQVQSGFSQDQSGNDQSPPPSINGTGGSATAGGPDLYQQLQNDPYTQQSTWDNIYGNNQSG